MSYTYGFFDAVDLGGGNFDRVYSSAEFSHYWALLVGDGVFGQPSTSLNVLAMEPVAMRVKVAPGTGWIKGHYLTVPDNMDEVILIPVANPSLPRIDSIIMALNNADRDMKLYVRSGTAAASPKPVTLQRDADVWELELAQITVAAGAGNISQTAIKDMRPDPNRCGIVTGLIDQFDVSGFFTAAQASFNEWFTNIQNQLGEDVAGNLLNLINGLDTRITTVEQKQTTVDTQLSSLGGRVSTNAYNIEVLGLMQAKQGKLPTLMKKAVVSTIAGSPNLIDYSGLVLNLSTFSSKVTTGGGKLELYPSMGPSMDSSLCFFRGKCIYTREKAVYEADDLTGANARALFQVAAAWDNNGQVVFYKASESLLYIVSLDYTNSESHGNFDLKIRSYDGSSLFVVASKPGLYNSNAGVHYKGVVFNGQYAYCCYYPGKSSSYGGGVLSLDGNWTGSAFSHRARSWVKSDTGVYFIADSFDNHSNNAGIGSFSGAAATLVAAQGEYNLRSGISFKGKAFFLGSSSNTVYIETGINVFKSQYVSGADSFLVIGGELYIVGTSSSNGWKYNPSSQSFTQDGTVWSKMGITSVLDAPIMVYGDYTGPMGLCCISSKRLLLNSNIAEGVVLLGDYDLGNFTTMELYVGLNLSGVKTYISLNGGSSWFEADSSTKTDGEWRFLFNRTVNTIIQLKITFPLTTANLDYIIGGVY